MTAPTLHAGDTWTPTRPGSRAKARTIMHVSMFDPNYLLWADGIGWAAYSHEDIIRAWIKRHAAVCTRAGDARWA